jgi:hypothetical protein
LLSFGKTHAIRPQIFIGFEEKKQALLDTGLFTEFVLTVIEQSHIQSKKRAIMYGAPSSTDVDRKMDEILCSQGGLKIIGTNVILDKEFKWFLRRELWYSRIYFEDLPEHMDKKTLDSLLFNINLLTGGRC